MGNVIEALRNGWAVLDVATVLARGQNDEGRGFLVTLVEPKDHISRKVYLPYSVETEALLDSASVSFIG
jgi:hypothetical protein